MKICRGPIGIVLAALMFAAVSATLSMPSGAQQAQTAQVVVVHGLRGFVADVYVDSKVVLEAFRPERVTDPLSLPVGEHLIEVREANAPATAKPALSTKIVLAAGERVSAVAHLGSDRKPVLTVFRDNIKPVTRGRSRLVVRDAAAAPAFDVLLNGRAVARNVTSRGQSESEVSANQYKLSLVAAGNDLAPSQNVPLNEGTVNFLYLIGSASDDSLGWLANKVDGVGLPPAAVQTGNSGLVGGQPSFPVVPVTSLLGVALCAGWWLRRSSVARSAQLEPALERSGLGTVSRRQGNGPSGRARRR